MQAATGRSGSQTMEVFSFQAKGLPGFLLGQRVAAGGKQGGALERPLAVGESVVGSGALEGGGEGSDRVKEGTGWTPPAAPLGEVAAKLSPCPSLALGWGRAVSTSSALPPQSPAVTGSPRKHPLREAEAGA